jgi:hypothetical protein
VNAILQFLKRHPAGATTEEVATALDLPDAKAQLRALRTDGCVRMLKRKVPRWCADDEFQCRQCLREYPDVRRQSDSNSCVSCMTAYLAERSRKASPATDSVVSPVEVGPAIAGSMSAWCLSQPIMGGNLNIHARKTPETLRCRDMQPAIKIRTSGGARRRAGGLPGNDAQPR